MSTQAVEDSGGKEKLVKPDYHIHTMLEVEVSFRVVVRYILDHLMDKCHLTLRKLAVLEVFTNDVAEDSAEILVTRI